MSTTIAAALDEAIMDEMRRDPTVFCLATSPMPNIQAEFGAARARTTPVAENAMIGISVGAALAGYRPVAMLGCSTFSFAAFEQLVNQAAKASYMFGAQASVPLVVRMSFLNGTRRAAQHSQTAYGIYAQVAGLKLIAPSTPADAGGLLRTAIRSNDPVICFEAERDKARPGDPDDGVEPIPFGVGAIRQAGQDVTIVGILHTVGVALQAASELSGLGISAEVIDPRTLVPLDVELIRESVRNTGRLVVVDESHPTCSFAAELISLIVEDTATFKRLVSPPRRVCAKPVPVPFSPTLEDFVLPDFSDVVDEVTKLF
jgi:pyruvate dehydrogenase E1 component beta subunit